MAPHLRRGTRAVFVDLDQTLVGSDGSLRPGASEFLEGLRTRGFRVFLWSAGGTRRGTIDRLGLDSLIDGSFKKPFPVEGRPATVLFTRLRRRLGRVICVDDDPAVVHRFGGVLVKPFVHPAPQDDELSLALAVIDARGWQPLPPVRALVDWRGLAPRAAAVGTAAGALLFGLIRLLLPAALAIQPLAAPRMAFAATSFGNASAVATPSAPVAVMTADIDGDGDKDIVATILGTGSASSKLVWYANNGSGGGWTENAIEADFNGTNEGGRAQGLAIADLDRDGDRDVVVSNGAGRDIYVYLNNGSGSFTRQTVVLDDDDVIRGIWVADINHDTYPDILGHQGSGATTGNEVFYYINPCEGDTSPPCALSGLSWPAGVALDGSAGGNDAGTATDDWLTVMTGDMDGDGFLDVVSISNAQQDLFWYANPCTSGGGTGVACTGFGAFTQTAIATTMDGAPHSVWVAKVGSDTDLDILVPLQDGTIDLYYNDGAGSFTKRDGIATGLALAQFILTVDLDGDSDQDLIVCTAGTDDDLSWFTSDGGTDVAVSFGTETELIDSNLGNCNAVWIAELTGDSMLEIIAAGQAADAINYYAGEGTTPTAVTLGSLTAARSGAEAVTLEWRTRSEYNVLGFHVYAVGLADGFERRRLTATPVSALSPGAVTGSAYTLRLVAAPALCYGVEELLADGSSTLYNPVCLP